MNRRNFLMKLGAGLVGALVVRSKFDINELWKPTQKQTEFLYGIPYHQSNGSMGTWLGIERDRVISGTKKMFEQDDIFYKAIKSKQSLTYSNKHMQLPLQIKPGVLR